MIDLNENTDAVRQSTHPYVVVPELFTVEECTKILNDFSSIDRYPGMTWNGKEFVENTQDRSVSNVYLEKSKELTDWIYDRFDMAFSKLAQFWGVDIDGTEEDLKYIVYSEKSHFSQWHQDTGPGPGVRRKISISVELVASDQYIGSDLHVFPKDNGHVAGPIRQAGTAIAFLSNSYHRVTPLEKGERHVLVNWVSGSPFR